ncbi:MAG: RecX family transcriptional regulator [Treponema sp.]|nr:RecX family transcriptional regulator [Treponema sp.]
MEIIAREVLSSGIHKIVTSDGSSFYIRPNYLKYVPINDFLLLNDFNDEQSNDILDSGIITACEFKAVEYLSRCEQCRTGLFKKILDKGYQKEYIEPALDYLESINYLSDERFCKSWLNMRKINHFEGRTRLYNELLSRGVKKETVNYALDEFFMENDEDKIAEQCFNKLVRKGKSGNKLIQSMIQCGFSYKLSQKLMSEINRL